MEFKNLLGGNNMTWTAQSGKTYQLVLLDTNALSDIVKNKKKEGLRFVTEFDAGGYAPCITIYTLFEIRKNEEAYKSFLKFFSVYPVFFLKPQLEILKDEIAAYNTDKNVSALFNAFTTYGKNQSHDLRYFIDVHFSKPENIELEKNWKEDERRGMEFWLKMRKNFKSTSHDANKKDAKRYVNEVLFEYLRQEFPAFVQQEPSKKKIQASNKFPSLQAMIYSQYYRIFDRKRKFNRSDVTDVRIMAASPYVDVIITENYQAEVFKKFKAEVHLLKELRVVRVGDLRKESNMEIE
jgi:hypothetical protein